MPEFASIHSGVTLSIGASSAFVTIRSGNTIPQAVI
jgi:hypothetical protein